jgi:hypothetical protein
LENASENLSSFEASLYPINHSSGDYSDYPDLVSSEDDSDYEKETVPRVWSVFQDPTPTLAMARVRFLDKKNTVSFGVIALDTMCSHNIFSPEFGVPSETDKITSRLGAQARGFLTRVKDFKFIFFSKFLLILFENTHALVNL